MKNTLPMAADARQPRGIITLNGARVDGWRSWDVTNNGFYRADTFRATFATKGLSSDHGPQWFGTQGKIEVEIFAGFPTDPASYQASELQSLIIGNVDDLDIDWRGGTIEISGRDLSAILIDAKSSEQYRNLTASQVVQQIASQYGLTAVVKPTTTKVGLYYQIDNVRLGDDRPIWDLLTWLAREEQYVVYMKGRELHFEPPPDAGQDPYVFRWVPGENGGAPQGNFTGLKTSHSYTLAKDIKVVVRSWNPKQKKAFSKTATRSHKGKGPNVQTYTLTIANLTPEQAQAKANSLLAEITKHEFKIGVEGPADNLLLITDIVKLEGTGTDWDQVYHPDTITRSMEFGGGYRRTVAAKNHDVNSTVEP